MIHLDIHKKLKGVTGEMNLHLDLKISKGEFITLYGDSGAGKTSTLRMIAGLMTPDSGIIMNHETTWFDSSKNIRLKPQKRNIGFMFQDYALFPNMTVKENLEFAIQNENNAIVSELIEMVELEKLQNQKPFTLSGGQKQRVALARALVQQPDILLLDEPLSALDDNIREKLQDYILTIHKTYNITTVLVSHDISEIMKLSDKVYVLQQGEIIKQGTPMDVFVGKSDGNELKLIAEVIHLGGNNALVRLQNNNLKITLNESQMKSINIGDKIVLNYKDFQPEILKIK